MKQTVFTPEIAAELFDALYELVYAAQQVEESFGDRDKNDKAVNRVIVAEKAATAVIHKACGETP